MASSATLLQYRFNEGVIILDSRLKSVIAEISENHSTKLCLPDLAAHAGLSIRRLEQLFVEETGMTYIGYRRSLRMKLARRLLLRSRKSVGKVTSVVGYRAAAYFCREFKKLHGCTTSRFRKSRESRQGVQRYYSSNY